MKEKKNKTQLDPTKAHCFLDLENGYCVWAEGSWKEIYSLYKKINEKNRPIIRGGSVGTNN